MRLLIFRLRDSLRDSFWFLPLVMAVLAAVGAFVSVAIDHAVGASWVRDVTWIWSGGPDGARSVLSTVAGSLMTVISIVFSLTITTLAQTASHFGPRVLRNFTSNRGVQFTLGTFIATFVFCLLVLRTVRSVEESQFVPFLSVNIGVLLTLASLAVLIFFIHHIAQSIQAETLTADVGRAILRSVPLLFPERVAPADATERPLPALPVLEWKTRVLARTLDFRDLIHASFDQIRMYGRANADVLMRLLDVIIGVVPLLSRTPDVETLAYHANLIATDAVHVENAYDRQRIVDRHRVALGVFAGAMTRGASIAAE